MNEPSPPAVVPTELISLRVPSHRLALWRRYAKHRKVSVSALIRFATDRTVDLAAKQGTLTPKETE